MGAVVHISGQRVTCDLHLTPIAPRRWALVNSVSDLVVGEIHVGYQHGAPCASAWMPSGLHTESDTLLACGKPCVGPAAFAAALRLLLRSIEHPAYTTGSLMR